MNSASAMGNLLKQVKCRNFKVIYHVFCIRLGIHSYLPTQYLREPFFDVAVYGENLLRNGGVVGLGKLQLS